jgi:sugar lactone lactonase YvrE
MRSLFLLAAVLPLYSQITIDTFAGGAVRSGVPAQNVFLESVAGLMWDTAGNAAFCDQQNHAVRRVRTDGILETIAGGTGMGFSGDGGPATAALLNMPANPRYDGAGNLYFADTGNFRIRKVDPAGRITTVAGNGIPWTTGMATSGPAAQLSLGYVVDLVVDAAGRVYWIDTYPTRVRVMGTDGQVRDFFTPVENDSLRALGTDSAGNVYIEDSVTYQYLIIWRASPDGTLFKFREWLATGNNGAPSFGAFTADAAGNVYVVGSSGLNGGNIERLGADGSTTLVAGGGGFGYVSSGDGPALNTVIYPFALAVDAHGNIAFADNFTPVNHYLAQPEIRVVTADGQLKTLAGGNPEIAPDGTPLKSAWFLNATSIAFSRTGDLYIAENRACKIRKIGADGVLRTFAGTGICAYPTPAGPNAKTSNIPQPGAIAVDSQGRVWMADAMLNLYSIAQDGTVSKVIKTPVNGGTGKIAIDSRDLVYVQGVYSLYRVLADGSYEALYPAASANINLGTLSAIGADAAGNVYFQASGTAYRVNDDGTYAPAYRNLVSNANSLAFDALGRVWQGDYSEIDVTGPKGTVRLGELQPGISGDGGPVNLARMWTARSVVFSPAGDLYFLDGTRVRLLTGIATEVPRPPLRRRPR